MYSADFIVSITSRLNSPARCCCVRHCSCLWRVLLMFLLGISLFMLHHPVPVHGADSSSALNLTQAERDFLDSHPRFRVHVERGYHPFAYVDQEGRARGFGVDLTDIIARRLGIEVDYVTDQSWEEGVAGLKDKEIDIVISMVDTPERRKFAHFTQPFLTTYTGMAKRTDAGFSPGLDELKGRHVGVIRGYWHEEVLRTRYPDVEIVLFPDHITALEALSGAQVDAVVSSNPVLSYHIRQRHMLGYGS